MLPPFPIDSHHEGSARGALELERVGSRWTFGRRPARISDRLDRRTSIHGAQGRFGLSDLAPVSRGSRSDRNSIRLERQTKVRPCNGCASDFQTWFLGAMVPKIRLGRSTCFPGISRGFRANERSPSSGAGEGGFALEVARVVARRALLAEVSGLGIGQDPAARLGLATPCHWRNCVDTLSE